MNKTKLIKFTYTKDSGEVSERTGITLGYSSPHLALIADLSEFTNEIVDKDYWITVLKEELNNARTAYLKRVSDILADYAIQQKTFKLSGITNEKEILF